mgnify:CR=1 FL=1
MSNSPEYGTMAGWERFSKRPIARVWVMEKDQVTANDAVAVKFSPSALVLVGPSGAEKMFAYSEVSGLEVTLPHTKHIHPFWISCGHMMLARDVPDSHVASQIEWHERMLKQLKERVKA